MAEMLDLPTAEDPYSRAWGAVPRAASFSRVTARGHRIKIVGEQITFSQMPTRLLSFFGSYDFLSKSLPGVAFVIGVFPLLKNNSISVPNISENFLVFITTLAILGIMGTLLGEVIHSIANHIEDVTEWAGKLLREVKDKVTYATGLRLPQPKQDSPNQRRTDQLESPPPHLRVYRLFVGTINGAYSRVYQWSQRRYRETAYIAWGHRSQFSSKVKSPASTSLIQQYLIEFVVNDLEHSPPLKPNEIYMIVTSFLMNTGAERAFRFQSRYAFCRSMGFVTFFTGLSYLTIIQYPSSWPIPPAFDYQPYLLAFFSNSSNPNSVIGAIAILLIIISFIFARAAGAYKKYYVDYLMSELYVMRELMDNE